MIYRSKEAYIPDECSVSKDGTVTHSYYADGKNHRTIVGYKIREGVMTPNSSYFRIFPDHWKRTHPDEPPYLHTFELRVGLFVLVLAVGIQTRLYPMLAQVYDPEIANAILDFAMYSILHCTNKVCHFSTLMRDHLLFSIKPHDECWYSRMFNSKMSETKNNYFRLLWLNHCMENKIIDVYLSVDGTNIEFAGEDNDLAKKAKSKLGTIEKVISIIWVVCASGEYKGLPITYFVVDGNVVDSRSVRKIIDFFAGSNVKINIKGIIADRGFCSKEIIEMLRAANLDYIIMLKSDTSGYSTMVKRHGDEIRGKLRYGILKDWYYGIADKVKLFSKSSVETCVGLYYNEYSATKSKNTLKKKLLIAVSKYNDAVSNGKTYAIPDDLEQYISVDDANSTITVLWDKVEAEYDQFGFSAIASSRELTAAEIDQIYDLRDASEKGFAQLKTELGFNKVRSPSETGALNRFFCGFIASIIRSQIVSICTNPEEKLKTNSVIRDIDRISYYFCDSSYKFSIPLSEKRKAILKLFGINDNTIISVSSLVSKRYDADEGIDPKAEIREFKLKKPRGRPRKFPIDGTESLPKDLADATIGGFFSTDTESDSKPTEPAASDQQQPKPEKPKRPRGRPRKERKPEEVTSKPKGKPGRKPGTKNKSTLERERKIAEGIIQVPEKRPVGRPKKQETIDKEQAWKKFREEAASYGIILPEKRSRGRQKSMDTLLREAGISKK